MDHDRLMHKALALAERALTLSNPNPRVGCVLVDANGTPIGQGHTQRAGAAHAEVMALRDARAQGLNAADSTAFVTLEPCSHHGRTPPCCDALIAAGVSRVVVATTDPNPQVAGEGVRRLQAAGIEVDVLPTDHPLAMASRQLNIGFFSRMIRKRPWVRMKTAASLDGITALPNGVSQWITGDAAREDGHLWRARACAVLTGAGTVLADDPRLDARVAGLERQPHLVVVDSRLDTPAHARLLEPLTGPVQRQVWLYHADAVPERIASMRSKGAEPVAMPGPQGKVDLDAMLTDLARREVNEVHVEAGAKLNASLLKAQLVDEVLAYIAPSLLGSGAGIAELGPLSRLNDRVRLRFDGARALGTDLRVSATVAGHDSFLRGQASAQPVGLLPPR